PVACCTSRLPEAGDVSEKGEPRQLGGNRRRLTTAPVASIVRVPMNFPGNFRRLGAIEIDGLRERALALTDEDWARESIRQQRYEVHRDTETIPLVYDLDFRHRDGTRRPALAKFEPALRPALALVADHYENSPAAGTSARASVSAGSCARRWCGSGPAGVSRRTTT